MRILAIYAFTHRIILYITSNGFDLDCATCRIDSKRQIVSDLKRWREVVDNNRGFKWNFGKRLSCILCFLHGNLFYLHGYNCSEGENLILTSFWL